MADTIDEDDFRQWCASMRELKRIAVECVERGNKQETEMPGERPIDEQETEMLAIHLMYYLLDCAKKKKPLQPLGPALAFARQADREKLTDRTVILTAFQAARQR